MPGITKNLEDYRAKPYPEASEMDQLTDLTSFFCFKLSIAVSSLLPALFQQTYFGKELKGKVVEDALQEAFRATLNIADLMGLELPQPEDIDQAMCLISEEIASDTFLSLTKSQADVFDIASFVWEDLQGDLGTLSEEDQHDLESVVGELFFDIHLLAMQFDIDI